MNRMNTIASFVHAHKHIHCMCEQITIDSQLSLSPVISTGVHWNDMHVVNCGESSVACELTDCELLNN
jgi:hypothetical protein